MMCSVAYVANLSSYCVGISPAGRKETKHYIHSIDHIKGISESTPLGEILSNAILVVIDHAY